MAKRKSLGRGLEALLSTPKTAAAPEPEADSESQLKDLPVDLLQRGEYQPRTDMRSEALQELADSIRAQGVVQPIVVRPLPRSGGELRYEIVAGERRWRAAQLAGLTSIPAVIRNIPDREAVAVALIENIQRENLNPMEEAGALARLIAEFEMTHGEAAEAVGRSRVAVSNLLRLLELPPEIKGMLERRELDMGHGRALLGCDDRTFQLKLARRAVLEGLSVREVERAVKRGVPAPVKTPTSRKDPDVAKLELELSERLGAPVSIQQSGAGGRLTVRYSSVDELEGILDHIR
jgi:ParB family chromosome partitioning protein